MLFGNTLLPAPTRLQSGLKCVTAVVAKQPESAAMLRIDHGVVDPFSEKASNILEAKLLCGDLSDSTFPKKTNHHLAIDLPLSKVTFYLAARGGLS